MTELENTNTGLHVGRAGTTAHLRLGTEAGPGLPRVGEQVGNQTRRACVATGRTAVPSRAAPLGAVPARFTRRLPGGAERIGAGRADKAALSAGGREKGKAAAVVAARSRAGEPSDQLRPSAGSGRATLAPGEAERSRAAPCGAGAAL